MTIMVIPHEGQQIFSLQLNWTMIAFISGIIVTVILMAIFAVYNKYSDASKKKILMERYGSNLQNSLNLNRLVQKNYNKTDDMMEYLAHFAVYSSMPKRAIEEQLPTFALAEAKGKDLLQQQLRKQKNKYGPLIDFLPPIYALKSLYLYKHSHLLLLRNVENSFNNLIALSQALPLGRPLRSLYNVRDTSGFGPRTDPITRVKREFHSGHDMAGPVGTPIVATAPGIVRKSFYNRNGYGRTIVIEHNFGFYTTYAHLSRNIVAGGMRVKRGQLIGTMGSSGRSTGSHLHYEVLKGEHLRIDPLPFICATDFYSKRCLRLHDKQKN